MKDIDDDGDSTCADPDEDIDELDPLKTTNSDYQQIPTLVCNAAA